MQLKMQKLEMRWFIFQFPWIYIKEVQQNLKIIIIIQNLKGIQQDKSPLPKDWFGVESITYLSKEQLKRNNIPARVGVKLTRIMKHIESIQVIVGMSFPS